MNCWNLAWRILSISLLVCERSVIVWAFFGIAFLWDWNENWPFPILWQNVVHWKRVWQTTSALLPWEPHESMKRQKIYPIIRVRLISWKTVPSDYSSLTWGPQGWESLGSMDTSCLLGCSGHIDHGAAWGPGCGQWRWATPFSVLCASSSCSKSTAGRGCSQPWETRTPSVLLWAPPKTISPEV